MSINIGPPIVDELKPKIAVIGVGGAGGNAVANMINAQVEGVDFIVAMRRLRNTAFNLVPM
jgi:cell division protein FtsZ